MIDTMCGYLILLPLEFLNEYVVPYLRQCITAINTLRLRIPVIRDFTANTFIWSGLIFIGSSFLDAFVQGSRFSEEASVAGLLLLIIGAAGKLSSVTLPFHRIQKTRWLTPLVIMTGVFLFWAITRNILGEPLVFGDISHITKDSLAYRYTEAFSLWQSSAFGSSSLVSFHRFFILLFLFLSGSSGAGFLFFEVLLPLLLSFFSIYFFLHRCIQTPRYANLLASLVYIVNPVVLATFNLGHSLYPFVFLPWIMYFLVSFFESCRYKEMLMLTIFLALLFNVYTSLFPSIILFIAVFSGVYLFTRKTKLVHAMLYVKYVVGAGVLFFFLMSPYWLSLQYARSPVPESALGDYHWNYAEATADNIFRLAGNRGSIQQSLGYNDLNWWSMLGLMLPVLVFYLLLRRDFSPLVYSLLVSSLVIVSILFLFSNYVLGDFLLTKFPYTATFRNSIKFQIPLAFLYATLLPISISALVPLFTVYTQRWKRMLMWGAVACFIGAMLIYNWPYLNGYLGLDTRQSFAPDTVFENISSWIHANDAGVYRTLIVPYDHRTELHIQNQDPYIYSLKFNIDTSLMRYFNFIEGSFNATTELGRLLAPLTIKYVVVNKIVTLQDFPFFLKEYSPQLLEGILSKQKDMNKIYETDSFSVYENKAFVPLLYAVNELSRSDVPLEVLRRIHPFSTAVTTMNENVSPLPLVYLQDIRSENLIDDASFESTVSEKQLGDCCIGMPGKPNIAVSSSSDRVDGIASLNLTSRNHCACVSKKIRDFKNSGEYILTIGYKHISGLDPSYCIWYSGCQMCKQKVNITGTSSLWQQYTTAFDADSCATDASLYFYANAYPGIETMNLYDNVTLQRVMGSVYSLGSTVPNISFDKRSPTKYFVEVTNATEPFLLVFSERYHEGWRAYINGTKVPQGRHIAVNVYAQGWYIDAPGSYMIEIEYAPQHWFIAALIISALTIMWIARRMLHKE